MALYMGHSVSHSKDFFGQKCGSAWNGVYIYVKTGGFTCKCYH